jgi:hypothetical protein
MQTEWAGASMTIPPISEPYRETVGARATAMDPEMAWANGDPRKVAGVVVRIAAEAAPPLRLLLGSDAYDLARAAADRRAAEDTRWEAVSRSTDRG